MSNGSSPEASAVAARPWRESVDPDRLKAWLDEQRLGHGDYTAIVPLAGGTQNILLRVSRPGLDVVLRRAPQRPAKGSPPSTIEREARVLKALSGSAVPHPALVAACVDPDVLGGPFFLMAPVDGFNPSGQPLPLPHADRQDWQRRIGWAMVDGLLALDALDIDRAGLQGLGRPEGFLARQVDRWRRHLAGCEGLPGWSGAAQLTGVDELGNWLTTHLPAAGRPGLLHGDFHLSNVMLRHDAPELAAIVDWELSTLGDPLLDLGWLLATWPDATGHGAGTIHVRPWRGFPTTDELLARYAARSTRDLSAMAWHVAMARYKLAILLESSHARACAGLSDAATGLRHHDSARHLIRTALDQIAQGRVI